MKKLLSFCVGVLALGALAVPEFVNKEGTATLTGEGNYVLGTAQNVSQLTMTATGSGVLGMSGEALNFTAGGLLDHYIGLYSFLNPVAAAGDFSVVAHGVSEIPVEMEDYGYMLATPNYVTLAKGVNVDDIEIVGGLSGGTTINSNLSYAPMHVKRGEGWLEAQMQSVSDWCKMVKVRLEQDGADIKGTVLYAKYLPTSDFGADFDVVGNGGFIAEGADKYGYGIHDLELRRLDNDGERQVAFKKGLAMNGGALTISPAANVEVHEAEGFKPASIELLGGGTAQLTITNTSECAFGVLKGSGIINFGGYVSSMTSGGMVTAPDVTISANWQVIAEHQSILSLESIKLDKFIGDATPAVNDGSVAYQYKLDKVALSATAQFQIYDNPWIKVIAVQLRQRGDFIEIRSDSNAYYINGNNMTLGEDIKQYAYNSFDLVRYVGKGFTMVFRDETITVDSSAAAQFAFDNESQMTITTINQFGGIATVSHPNGLPIARGQYNVLGGGRLVLAPLSGVENSVGVSKGNTSIYVGPGSTLEQASKNAIDPKGIVVIDGGTLDLLPARHPSQPDGYRNISDSANYICNLELRNGGHVINSAPRLGHVCDTMWKITGTGAAVADVDLVLASTKNGSFPNITFNVENTTDDAAADFIVTKLITPYNADNKYCKIFKRGAGTMVCQGQCGMYYPITIEEGTWQLVTSGQFTSPFGDHTSFTLVGGTLAEAAGIENSMANLNLSQSSTVALADGATLTVNDCAGSIWDAAATLYVTGPIRSNAISRAALKLTGITEQQLAQVRWLDEDGHPSRVTLAADGSIIPVPRSTLITIR